MAMVVVEVWPKLYVVEVEVEVGCMDDVSIENIVLLARKNFMVSPVPLACHHLKEVRSTGYILDLISLDL